MYPTRSSPFTIKIGTVIALSRSEAGVVDGLHRHQRFFAPGQTLVREGSGGQVAYILLSGWASSYKTRPDGSRQIIDIQVPGDFLGLRSILLEKSDHSVEPVVDIRVAEMTTRALSDAFVREPRVAAAILWAASRDQAMTAEHLIGLGRRDALERMAHFLLELGMRLSLVGEGSEAGYACPLTQERLADTLGLSTVHVNRVLRTLREMKLVTFRNGYVTFDDRSRLVAFAGFDPSYLDQAGSDRV